MRAFTTLRCGITNCQLVATIRILSSKSGSNSNLKFIILFRIPVKTHSVQSESLLKNVYTKIWFSAQKMNGACRFLPKRGR